MKLLIEMTDKEWEEYKAYRAGKREEDKAKAELTRVAIRLCDGIRGAVTLYPKEKKAEIDYDHAKRLLDLANSVLWEI